jgi:hypothetical protein
MMTKENLPAGLTIWYQEKDWTTNAFMIEWIEVAWNQRPGFHCNKHGMLVLDAFKGHLIQEVK